MPGVYRIAETALDGSGGSPMLSQGSLLVMAFILGFCAFGGGLMIVFGAMDRLDSGYQRRRFSALAPKIKFQVIMYRVLVPVGVLVFFGGTLVSCLYGIDTTYAVSQVVEDRQAHTQLQEEAAEAVLAMLQDSVAAAATEAELWYLVTAQQSAVRSAIAEHPAVTEGLQVELATDPVWSVRHDLAEVEMLFPAASAVLARDPSSEIRLLVASRSDTVPTLLTQLVSDDVPAVALAAFRNPSTPAEVRCGNVQQILGSSEGDDPLDAGSSDAVDYCTSFLKAKSVVE